MLLSLESVLLCRVTESFSNYHAEHLESILSIPRLAGVSRLRHEETIVVRRVAMARNLDGMLAHTNITRLFNSKEKLH